MQELGEALVNLLDLYSIEYVVGLGEGAGANILARWRIERAKYHGGIHKLRAFSFPSIVSGHPIVHIRL